MTGRLAKEFSREEIRSLLEDVVTWMMACTPPREYLSELAPSATFVTGGRACLILL
jgi:hypothetical protein